MRLKPGRNLIEKGVGFVLSADGRLVRARATLQNDYFKLKFLLSDRCQRMEHQAFIDRTRERYDHGLRSVYYRFASERAQRDYDLVWQRIGDLIKTSQTYRVISRTRISLDMFEE